MKFTYKKECYNKGHIFQALELKLGSKKLWFNGVDRHAEKQLHE